MQVLLIEDSPTYAAIVEGMLARQTRDPCEVAHVVRLSEGLDHLAKNGSDVVLLDLGLPDSSGLDGLHKLRELAPSVPVVVLTGTEDETIALGAVRHGAQDYLVKGPTDGNLLVRSLRYAAERQRLLIELEETRLREQHERELRLLERSTATAQSPSTATMFGQRSLQEARSDEFRKLVECYAKLIDLALEVRTFKVDHDLHGQLRSLAERMGFLKVVPRDVVEVHSVALSRKTTASPFQKNQACREEGQFMLLEVMGHLCSFYRNYATGIMSGDQPEPAAKIDHERKKEQT